jgi:hypothetical protein
MPRMHPVTVRRQIISRLGSGEPVAAVTAEAGIAQATLFRWKRQALFFGARFRRITARRGPMATATGTPHILLGPIRRRETPARFSTSTEDREAGPDNVVPLVSGSK